jgi:phage gp16-like protein
MPKPKVKRDYKAGELAKIHIAKKELGMDDDTYRDMLMQVAKVSSAADLTATGRGKVLEHLKKIGFKGKKTYAKRPNTTDNKAQLAKIEAQLADMKLPWGYLTARQQGRDGKTLSMVERLTGKQRLEWCTKAELSKVIAALAVRQKKLNKEEK